MLFFVAFRNHKNGRRRNDNKGQNNNNLNQKYNEQMQIKDINVHPNDESKHNCDYAGTLKSNIDFIFSFKKIPLKVFYKIIF